jgi:hypothetical protein
MTYQFNSIEALREANGQLSKHFSGNGRHYEYNPHSMTIEILSNCPDYDLAANICQACGGYR